MNSKKTLWNFIHHSLKSDLDVILMYVVDSNGSSPGRQGFAMAINEEYEMEGSIGGGIMEHKFVELAKQKIRDKENISSIRKQIHDKISGKEQSGMICSGDQTIVLMTLTAEDLSEVELLVDAFQKDYPVGLHLSSAGLAISRVAPDKKFAFNLHVEENWTYTERIGYSEFLHIIGGGHCSLALSELMERLGFHVTVYDERHDLNTMKTNGSAHVKKFIADYSTISDVIPEGEDQYIVIMTFGYRTDFRALKSIAGKKFKYVGVLGSRKKMESLFHEFRNEGSCEDFINFIHSPVGIAIRSQTPWEIAVSVAAEIIGVKNQRI